MAGRKLELKQQEQLIKLVKVHKDVYTAVSGRAHQDARDQAWREIGSQMEPVMDGKKL